MSLAHKLAQAQSGVSRLGMAALAVMAALVAGVGGWAVSQSIQDAVMAPGKIVVNSQRKKLQHQDGGIVSVINVAEGDNVSAGDVLIRLDAKLLSAELGSTRRRIFEMTARRWRMLAERDGDANLPDWQPPAEIAGDAGDSELAAIVVGQRRLFETKRLVLTKQKEQLHERINQLRQQVTGLDGQLQSSRRQLVSTQGELKALIGLRDKGLLP